MSLAMQKGCSEGLLRAMRRGMCNLVQLEYMQSHRDTKSFLHTKYLLCICAFVTYTKCPPVPSATVLLYKVT